MAKQQQNGVEWSETVTAPEPLIRLAITDGRYALVRASAVVCCEPRKLFENQPEQTVLTLAGGEQLIVPRPVDDTLRDLGLVAHTPNKSSKKDLTPQPVVG